jgi:GNAT superfamily N-acetyltransferase
MSYVTVPLNAFHKKSVFNCGKALLDNYLHVQAKQDVKRKLAACFVLTDEHNKVKGYFTLSSASISKGSLPEEMTKKLPAYEDLPVTLLGRLAVDSNYKGQGLGEFLLMDALRKCYDTSSSIGSMAVIVDPIDDSAVNFYRKFGFILLPDSGKMLLPMTIISTLFA